MSATTGHLGRAHSGTLAVPPTPRAAGILHLGLGSFHRAHQAVYTRAALAAGDLDWGIVGVASRSPEVVAAMAAQDLLYTVATVSPDGTSLTAPAVHTDAYVAAEEPERVVRGIADPGIRIITLTVTERGYSYTPATGRLDLDDPLIAADLRGGAPRSTIGQLARGLQHRAARSGAPLTVLSCDNLAANGRRTESLVREFLTELPTGEGAEALAFLDQSVAFPSSMVDRIVPATTPALRDRVGALLGVRDEITVPAEPFSMWAIEDRFAAGRPAWQRGGAIFTTEVELFEQLKVRLLNGTHSLIAYLGALSGAETIPDAIMRGDIARAAHGILEREFTPSIQVPSGIDIDTYQRQLFERWANSALGHRTSQVGTDGSVKLAQRIPEPALRLLDRGETPQLIALTVAAYLSCLAPLPGFEPGPFAAEMKDAARGPLTRAGARTGAQLAEHALGRLRLFGDQLAERPVFSERVGDLVDLIARHGVTAAIEESIRSAESETEKARP